MTGVQTCALPIYLADIYGDKMGDTISTPDLFKVKQDLNKDYQRVAKKINAGSELTPREQVVKVARKTVDDIIAQEHPNVKKQTLQQSNLFDATDSLYNRARKQKIKGRIPFTGIQFPLPGGAIRGGEDYLGGLLQGK